MSLNTLIVLLGLNLAAGLALALYRGRLAPPPGALRYGLERLAQVYPGRSAAEIEQLLSETWAREYVYSPFVQHREGPLRGRFVNVDAAGFRHSADQGPWPPDADALNIFVFGGSTTFGYGVADDETIPSRLQEALAERSCVRSPRVYNFGRGNYYSEQERVLFEDLLSRGAIPQVALFVDGLNEWKETPKFTARLEYLLAESDGQLARRALKQLPIVELLRRLRGAVFRETEGGPGAGADEADRALAEVVLRRWRRSKRLIEAAAAEFGVLPLFVWQPVPTYEYQLDFHLFAAESARAFAAHGALRHGYRLMDLSREAEPDLEPSGDFLWLADMQRGRRQPLYVDAAHYTAAFADELAGRIADALGPRVTCVGPSG